MATCALASSLASATVSISLPFYQTGVYFGTVNPSAIPPANVSDQPMLITNNGDEVAWVMSFSFNPSTYSLLNHNCSNSLAPGATCTANIRFNPAGYGNGAVSGTVYVNVYGAPYQFMTTLQGTSYSPPGTLTSTSSVKNFGEQAFGASSVAQTLTFQNTGSSAVTAGAPASSTTDYLINSSTCTGTIAPGATCNVQVTMIPSATGTLTSTITLPHSGTGSVVTVTGTGGGEAGLVFGGGGTTGSGGTNVEDKNTGGLATSTTSPADGGCDLTVSCGDGETATGNTTWSTREIGANNTAGLGRFPIVRTQGNMGGRITRPADPAGTCTDEGGGGGDTSNGGDGIAPPNPADDIGANTVPTDPSHTADPIHAGLGNKSHPQTDYAARGGYGLAFIRTYQAQAPNASALVRQKMGPGWYSNWDKSVNLGTNGPVITARVLRGDGGSILFNKQSNGTWNPASSDIVDTLATVYSGIYENGWTYKIGNMTENYNSVGRLTSITLSTGESYVLTYDASARVKTVTDPASRVLTFNYDAKERLANLVDPAGTTTTYTYDDVIPADPAGDPSMLNPLNRLGRLMAVTFPDSRARHYKYGISTRKFALTSIATFENGVENTYVTFTYDASNGRATGNSFGSSATEAQRSGRAAVYFNPDGSSVAYDPSRVVRDAQGNYNLITAGQYPSYATVKRNFTTVQGMVLPTSIEYRHVCASCPAVMTESFAYNADGRLTSQTDRNGVTTTYSYTADGRGLLASSTQAAGTGVMRTVSTTWHPTFRVPTQVLEPTRTTTYTYDAAGRTLTTSVAATGQPTRTTTNTYNAQGWLASVNGPRTDVSDITTYTYHANGNLYQVTNPKGQVTTYNNYDAHGNPTVVLNPNGTTSTFVYDARGRLTYKSEGGLTTSNTYTINGLLNTVTDPYGSVTTYQYDDAHRLIGKTQSNGEHIAYTLDNAGRTIMTQTFDAQNNLATTTSTVYDGLNRVMQKIEANGKITSYSYDANGNVTSVIDPNNLTTATQYDVLNRPILVTDPNLKTIATTYTADDKVATVKDPNFSATNNSITSYSYNGFGEQTAIQSPDTGSTTMSYNAGGLLSSKVDARGKTTTYVYDVLGRVTQIGFNDGNILQTYDVAANGVGRLASVSDLSGATSYSYDAYGRVTGKTTFTTGATVSRILTYGRDAQGRITSITYPSGNVVGMSYAQGRIINMTLNSSPLISAIEYFPLGGPESWLLGANVAGVKDYTRFIDLNSRIEKYSTPTGYRKLTFDNGSRIIGLGDYLGASTTTTVTQTFVYDNVGRLTSFSGFTSNGNAQPNVTQTQSFTYDNNGNRLTSVLNGTTSTYTYQSGNNRLASVTGGISKTNTYDLSGNLTGDGSAVLTYDARGRMITANASGLSTNYLINYQNLRVKKSNASETRYFVYDDSGHMMGEYDSAGNVVQELVWLGDTPVAVRGTMPCLSGTSCTEVATAYVWTDHLNTPRELTRINASNQHVSIWKWDSLPFGETTPNANPSNLGTMTFNHRFPGQYRDNETGLHQNWNREYDPKLGRYIQSDPIGIYGGLGLYTYASNDPLYWADPSGLTPCDIEAALAAARQAAADLGWKVSNVVYGGTFLHGITSGNVSLLSDLGSGRGYSLTLASGYLGKLDAAGLASLLDSVMHEMGHANGNIPPNPNTIPGHTSSSDPGFYGEVTRCAAGAQSRFDAARRERKC